MLKYLSVLFGPAFCKIRKWQDFSCEFDFPVAADCVDMLQAKCAGVFSV
jgi:hypothetical protein